MARSASSRRVSFCLSKALWAGLAASSLVLTGCDTESGKADKTVNQKLDQATLKLHGPEADAPELKSPGAKGGPSERAEANLVLEDAAKDPNTSTPVKLRAKLMLADAELRTALSYEDQVQAADAIIDRLSREIMHLGARIDANNHEAAALAKLDPAPVQSAITQKQTDIKGSDDKPDWYKSADIALASLSADDKQAAALTQQAQQLTEKIKGEGDQRNDLLQKADAQEQQSKHEEKKEESTKLYMQAVDLRHQAADLSVQMDIDNLALTRAQDDLKVRQGQQESLSTALKTLDVKSAFFADDWKAVQGRIAELEKQTRDILGDDPVAADGPKLNLVTHELSLPNETDKKKQTAIVGSIGWKAAAIESLARIAKEQRQQSEAHLNSAIGFYKESGQLADAFARELNDKLTTRTDPSTSAIGQALTAEKATLDPAVMKYSLANAQLAKARMQMRLAHENKSRLEMATAIKTALGDKVSNWPTLQEGSLATDMKTALDAARTSFTDAHELLDRVASVGPTDLRNSAVVETIFSHLNWATLETMAGDPQKAAEQVTLAKTQAAQAVSSGSPLPPLPPEVAPAGGPATPGTTPRTPAPGTPPVP